jgi:hypothetical protein
MLQLTPIEETGLTPYQVQGDPTVALLAQLNRFAGESVAIGTCGEARFVGQPFALKPGAFDERAAFAAATILIQRYACSSDTKVGAEYRWALSSADNEVAFVKNNIDRVTLIIAQVGDAAGLDAAVVGITEVDPKLKPMPTWVKVVGVGVGLLGISALVSTLAKRRKRLRAA